ncbi:MAG: hypothetical protein Q9191_003205 [Dirinaria sp. TL-2023a]
MEGRSNSNLAIELDSSLTPLEPSATTHKNHSFYQVSQNEKAPSTGCYKGNICVMGPITAFSLACGVIQVVAFSIDVVKTCKEIYDRGTLAEYEDIEHITKHLAELELNISLLTLSQPLGSTQMPGDKALKDLIAGCSATAKELIKLLDTIKIGTPQRKRETIKKALRSFRVKKQIQDIQKRLDSYQNAVDTHVLISLRQRCDLNDLKQSESFQSLEEKVQDMINTLSEGPKKFDDIAKAIQGENQEIRNHIDSAFKDHRKLGEEQEYYRRLLKSLWFTEIYSREERIADAHRQTFEWVFDQSGQALGPWDNFAQWLETGQNTYWINGKAGSGKSTLMSFLCEDARTKNSLMKWSGSKPLLTPKFFFWTAGTPLQKSVEGLLRSLIWQVLKEMPNTHHRQSHFLGLDDSAQHGIDNFAAWTDRRLQNTFREVVHWATSSHRLCLFIDGLDEYAGDEDELINLIEATVQRSEVKICLSSRPHRAFAQAFESSAQLRLQDLTRTDIEKFVVDQFKSVSQVKSISSQQPRWLERTTSEILWKAQGVFLWVSLAVKDQIRGLKAEDSPQQLEERLASLPSELEGIYERMLYRIETPHRREASSFLTTVLHHRSQKHPSIHASLLDLVLASREDLADLIGSAEKMPELELIHTSSMVRRRVQTICAGLLEVFDKKEGNDWDEEEGNDFIDYDEENVDDDEEDSKGDYEEVKHNEEDEHADDDNYEVGNSDSDIHGRPMVAETENKGPYCKGELTEVALKDLEFRTSVEFIHRTAFDFMRESRCGISETTRVGLNAGLYCDFEGHDIKTLRNCLPMKSGPGSKIISKKLIC